MANIKDFIKKIGNSAVSLEEQQQVLAQVEKTIIEAKQKRTEAVGKNADMVIQALKTIEAKLEAKLNELNNTPAKQGVQGPAGQDGKDGKDGQNGRDGLNGKDGTDGKDGVDGKDGISVVDAKIDFDGSLVVYLSNGSEIDCGQILQPEVAKNIIISSGGSGTSQVVTDTLVSLQNQINTLTGIDGVLGDMAQQNANAVAITGGTINGTTIGATTAVAGSFTDLSVTGTTSFDGSEGTSGQVLTSQGVGNTPIWATASGGISTANIQEFTTAGTSTWTKPAGAKLVYIVCQGGGGGGGSGYKQLASPVNAAISGGGGGGTGGWSELLIPAALLGSTETVTTGAGGTGGASQTVAGSGNAGTTGGDSSFGSWCVARGGVGNVGGGTGTSGGGSTSSNNVNFVSIIVTTTVLSGSTTTATRGQAGTSAIKGGKSGGGGASGGGIVVATPTALAGGTGGEGGAGIKSTSTTTTGGGGAGGTSGSPNATSGSNSTNEYIGGDGGGGGASQITANGGNGGNGGNSAGGGGGGACQNAYNSGAGGNGGDGSVMVITFF